MSRLALSTRLPSRIAWLTVPGTAARFTCRNAHRYPGGDHLIFTAVGGPAFELPKIANRKELLAEFDKNVAESHAALSKVSDAEMMKNWKLLAGGQEIFTMPRVACIRGMVMNHLIHHRAQLTVYYRLLGIPVPGLYGPSADEGQDASAGAAAH